jgi:hypothetical protein
MDAAVVRCAVLARAVDEPLAGTAPVARRWVCLENRGAWPSDVGRHPDPDVAAFARRATASGWRLLLIRRPGRRCADAAGRVYLTDTTPSVARTTQLTVAGPAELAALPLPTGGPLPGETVTAPVLMVCTHGRRDRCCAVDGRALALAVGAGAIGGCDVWECSHLGGHRFAPTALVLPTGYLYGRLDVSTAVSARKAAGLGEMEAALCRGRSTWSPAGQVAELAVRAATGLRDADALTVVDGAPVTVRARDGRVWTVDVEPDDGPTRPPSCGADAVPARVLRATNVRRRA